MAAPQQAIEASLGEISTRVQALRAGMRLAAVRAILGGDEFSTEAAGDLAVKYWRYHVQDAEMPASEYAIYRGQFRGDGFIDGWILPQG